VGDYIGEFSPGYLTIIGPNIPHNWVPELKKGQIYRNRDVVLQFHENIFHNAASSFPEFQQLFPFLRAAKRGLEFYGGTAVRGAELMESIGRTTGYRRLLLFFDLLSLLARTSESRPLVSVGYVPCLDDNGARVVNKVISYIMANLHSVKMGDAARMAGMSEPTFSRFFKKSTGNTFVDFTHKIRISHACRLLTEASEPITSVCSAAGYSNISNFNRHFLAEKKMTPSHFRRTANNLESGT
jgi:AraC-like DNA-binding protein